MRPSIFFRRETASVALPTEFPVTSSTEVPRWSPLYLRRRVLATFAAGFVILGVIIEVLLSVSNKQQGLATTHQDLYYLWKYGPTAGFTLVAALWGRVEFQAKMMAPWCRLANSPAEADRSLFADYLSIFQPYSIVKGIRNRDYVVAVFSAISIIIRILMVISTAFITLSPTQVSHSTVPITLQSQFVNDPTGLKSVGTLPFYIMSGLLDFSLPFPDGLSSNLAFQSIRSDLPPTTKLHATVDGFIGGLNCEPAILNVTEHDSYTNLTLHSPNCQLRLDDIEPPFYKEKDNFFARFVGGTCSMGTDMDNKRVGVIYGIVSNQSWRYWVPKLLQSTQLICIPTYNISSIRLSKNGTQTLGAIPSDSPSPWRLSNVPSWEIMQALLDVYFALYGVSAGNTNVTGVPVHSDAIMSMVLELRNQTVPSLAASSLLDVTVLQDAVTTAYQQLSAILAYSSLMRPATILSSAPAITQENRLIVHELASHLMAGLLFLCAVIVGAAWLALPNYSILPQNPNTIINTASLLASSYELLLYLPNLGAANLQILSSAIGLTQYYSSYFSEEAVGTEYFAILPTEQIPGNDDLELVDTKGDFKHPSVLLPAVRFGAYALTVSFVIALEVVLRISQQRKGLGDVSDENYLHYSWTTPPAVIFSLLALYLAAVDFQCRCLTPFVNLSLGTSFDRSVGLDLLDRTTPFALAKEIQTRNYATLAITIAGAISSLFTIFSASLFTAVSLPASNPVPLQTTGSFSYNITVPASNPGPGSFITSLVLESNLSYPAFTYENLAFPELTFPMSDLEEVLSASNQSELVVNTIIPAVRSKLDCRLYDASQMRLSWSYDTNTSLGWGSEFDVFIDEENCARNVSKPDPFTSFIITSGRSAQTKSLFGKADISLGEKDSSHSCSQLRYVWGRFDPSIPQDNGTLVGALGCNETLETVQVQTSFFGSDLRIDPTYPPIVLDSTAQKSATNVDTRNSLIYDQLVNVSTPTGDFDIFFSLLTTSRYAVPVAALGDPKRTAEVAAAAKFQHSVLRAMMLDAEHRAPSNITNATLPDVVTEAATKATNDDVLHAATITDPLGRRRLIQDAASTRVLEVLLAVTLVLSLLGWAGMRNTNLLPRSPTSIASTAALLVDGNLFYRLPRYGEVNANSGLGAGFGRGAIFRLGWITQAPEYEGERFVIYYETKDLKGGENMDENRRSLDAEADMGLTEG